MSREPHEDSTTATTTAPLDMHNLDDPRKFFSREATRIRQEKAQQQLVKAYRPLGGMELFRGNTTAGGFGQPSRGWVRPQSNMSSRTSASGGSLANGRLSQSRGASRESNYSTIMTTYGSRRIRTAGSQGEANTAQSLYSRPRHPLIFKDPDEYDNSKRKPQEHQDEM
ncbi:hypothetical protein PoB_003975800 [Plakobranchus ocellatus]|uniref:Uncharacterized protein n=1 Tax=Plakobranchus ocellatus TaxID=259542 RepID=A0AAV4B121_9GAST|nr:hypothetical protein PoB_003975800 [Plakobranchus ocellatus]